MSNVTRALVWAVVGCAAFATAGCKNKGKGASAAARARGYDVTPMLSALRPSQQRAGMAKKLGLASLADLPLYDIAVAIDPGAAKLRGRLRLRYRNPLDRSFTRLPLLLHPNAPRELGVKDSGTLDVTAVRAEAGPKVTLQRERPTLVWLKFARPVKPGERVVVDVKYRGTLRRLPANANDIFSQALASLGIGGGGAGASDYGLLASGDGIISAASAYPTVAPYRRGQFDTAKPGRFGDLAYNGLANFKVNVSVPDGVQVFTNLRDASSTRLPASAGKPARRRFSAMGALNRDLVIVAGASLTSAKRVVTGQGDPITVRSIYKRGDAAAGQRALTTAVQALTLFQQRYGPYPYGELDVAEATLVGGAGGVEFPGLVLVAGMFYRPPSRSSSPMASMIRLVGQLGSLLGRGLHSGGGAGGGSGGSGGGAASKPPGLRRMDELIGTMRAFTVAHEVAHQYFAGLVGADCRADPAVDEPLAQFSAGQLMEKLHGRAAGRALLAMNAKMNYGVYRMLGGKDLPAGQPVNAFPTALAYAAIVYGKAPYFYVAQRDRLGAARFDAALRKTVDRFRFRLVTLDQWLAELDKNAGGLSSGVALAARRWLHQTPGDADLGVDGSGKSVLTAMLGKATYEQLSRALGAVGMSPASLFRMVMGNAGGGAGGGGGKSGGGLGSALGDLLKSLTH